MYGFSILKVLQKRHDTQSTSTHQIVLCLCVELGKKKVLMEKKDEKEEDE